MSYFIDKYFKDYTRTRKTVGDWSATTEAGTTYKGYIQPITGNEIFQEGKAGEKVTHRLYTTVAADIVYGDKITQDSVSYKVVFSDQVGGITNRNHHKEILISRFV